MNRVSPQLRQEDGAARHFAGINASAPVQAQRLEALGRLAGGIAHDFNNILVAIFAYADLGDLHAESPAEVRSHMAELRIAAARGRDLTRQILTFASERNDHREHTSLSTVVGEVLNLLRSTLPSSVHVHSEIDATVPATLGFAGQFHQVVMNLCVNAVQAMENSGTLSLQVTKVTPTPQLIARVPDLVDTRVYACLTVRDTGPGMDARTLEHIFEPFFTTKADNEGTGLGLAVVQSIVRSHGGALSVESAPGLGTRFDVYFPGS